MRQNKNNIVKGLHAHLNVDVVPTDTASRKPEYPYLSYKIITEQEPARFAIVYEAVPSTNPNFDTDVKVIRKEQNHFTMSINAYSMDEDEARELAIKAAEWFSFTGYHYFASINVAVIKVGEVTDRTQQLVDDYERRYGFDVRIRAAKGISKRLERIEGYAFNGSTNPE